MTRKIQMQLKKNTKQLFQFNKTRQKPEVCFNSGLEALKVAFLILNDMKNIEDFRNLRNKNGDNVKTIAVSKRSTSQEILSVYNLNHKDFGENRVQDLIVKYTSFQKILIGI